jgi:hypothetical protein
LYSLPFGSRGSDAWKSIVLGSLNFASFSRQNASSSAASALARDHARRGLDHRLDLLAPLLVRDAEHRDVADLRVLEEDVLDLGRVDVRAARDDHVDLAVAQEEVARFVQVADVADREVERVVLHDPVLLRLLLVALVLELPGLAELHVHGALPPMGTSLPASSTIRISAFGHALPTVPGYFIHSCGVTSVPPPSVAA